jgi:hypothetical protein
MTVMRSYGEGLLNLLLMAVLAYGASFVVRGVTTGLTAAVAPLSAHLVITAAR